MTKKILIFFFTGTGNTYWVANELSKLLSESDDVEKADLISIEDREVWENQLDRLFSEYDIIGLGFPVYASSIPLILKDFINELPVSPSKQVFVFDTMMIFAGDPPYLARRLMKSKGYSIKQGINVMVRSNLGVPGFNTTSKISAEKLEKVLNKARKKLRKFRDFIIQNKKWMQRRDPISLFLALLQRAFESWEIKWIRSNLFIDEQLCTNCNFCVEHCPVNNIRIVSVDVGEESSGDNTATKHEFGNKCTLCMRCYNLCPTHAVLFGEKSRDDKKYLRYKPITRDFLKYAKKKI